MEPKITATYDQDSKKYHRFLVDSGQEVTGSLYIPKTKQVPEKIVILLKTPGETKAGKKEI